MRVLIAEDNLTSRRALEMHLVEWGYEVVSTADGTEAWEVFQSPDPPRLAVLDWMMPQMDGVEVCRRVRSRPTAEPPYIVLLTARADSTDVVAGLESGADDYLTKPVERAELRARLQAGRRVVDLQSSLAARVRELESALSRVKQLQRLLPICCYCKKVRGDENYWQQVEASSPSMPTSNSATASAPTATRRCAATSATAPTPSEGCCGKRRLKPAATGNTGRRSRRLQPAPEPRPQPPACSTLVQYEPPPAPRAETPCPKH
jgi:CheY-like chemotaxis protein